MNSGYKWIIDIDLERFFDTVHHDKLMRLVANKVKDGTVISLIRKNLVSGVMVNDEYKDSVIGTQQGGNISPLLSNIMLNELDNEIEKRNINFVRYADDCIIFARSRKSTERIKERIIAYIEIKLGLKVNAEKSQIIKTNNEAFKYIGYGFYWDKQAEKYEAKPHKISLKKFHYKLKRLSKRNWGVSTEYRVHKINQTIRGWVNYFKLGSMKTILSKIDQKLRMCIWKQWKTIQARRKNLIKLGVDRNNARKCGSTSKSYARIAMSWVLTTTITNKRLAQFGLVSAQEYYLKQIPC